MRSPRKNAFTIPVTVFEHADHQTGGEQISPDIMRRRDEPRVIQAVGLLERMAVARGWRLDPQEECVGLVYARAWVSPRLGIEIERKCVPTRKGCTVIARTVAWDSRYQRLAKRWAKLCGIDSEDARSILELVASFEAKEALISEQQKAEKALKNAKIAMARKRSRIRFGAL
jgi:hypothetical protein